MVDCGVRWRGCYRPEDRFIRVMEFNGEHYDQENDRNNVVCNRVLVVGPDLPSNIVSSIPFHKHPGRI